MYRAGIAVVFHGWPKTRLNLLLFLLFLVMITDIILFFVCLFPTGNSVTGCKRIVNTSAINYCFFCVCSRQAPVLRDASESVTVFSVFNAVTPATAPGYSVTEIAVDVSRTHNFVLTAFPKANVQFVKSRLDLLLCHT